jgi:gamma-glutamylcyclotransferase (GGCT)/AIG2-like uncharacterized protein YtfP
MNKSPVDNKEYLFVYGLFRDSARPLLGEYIVCGKSSVKGQLFLVNEFYPGWISNSKNTVWGDIFMIEPDVFSKLDEFEGSEYRRRKIKTLNDIECWIYEYIHNTDRFKEIKSGDWLLR